MDNFPLFPEQASNHAVEMDLLYFLLVALTLVFSLLVFVPIIFFAVRYHRGSKADRSNPVHHHLKLELAWAIIPFMLGIPVFLWSAKLFMDIYKPIESDRALEITIVGKQWMWHLQHPTGHRENNELHIPTGRPIKLTMISQDVLHSFYVPAFRVKHDVLPGRYVSLWFEATKPGRYRLYCAEYCGTMHSEMIGWVTVLEPADYERWLETSRWGMDEETGGTMADLGEKLYREFGCVSCHDPGTAPRAPTLAGIFGTRRDLADGRRVLADEGYIRRKIYQPDAMTRSGYEPIMPSYVGLVDEQQVLQLIAYIRSLREQSEDPGDSPALQLEDTQ